MVDERRTAARLHARDEGSGRAIVLVHGFPVAGWMWDDQVAPLAARRRALVPDLRGFGRSPLPPDPAPSIDDYADDLVALLDARGIERATFAGLSMGGYVVLSL